MRTQHPNLWHPIRFAIMLIVLAWTIYGVCYEPPTDIFGVIWVAMLVTALVLSPLFLKSTSVAILVIASIGDLFTPYAHLGNSLPAQLYAYGMLAYSTNAIIVATLLIYYVVNILLIDPPDPNTNPVAMVSMYAMVLLLGRMLSWSEKTTQKSFEAAQNKNRLQELESRARIADAIHDAVTGDLSAASFVAQRHIGGNSSGPGVAADPANATTTTATTTADAEDWRQINEYILSALTNVHRVIDELNMDATTCFTSTYNTLSSLSELTVPSSVTFGVFCTLVPLPSSMPPISLLPPLLRNVMSFMVTVAPFTSTPL